MNIVIKIIKKITLLAIIITLLITAYIGYSVITGNPEVSTSGKVANAFYRIIKPKRFLPAMLNNPKRIDEPLSPSSKFSKTYETIYRNLEGNELMTAYRKNPNNTHIIYLHGGAYVLGKDGMGVRETLLSQLIDLTQSKVTYFDYPVAPEAQFEETLAAVALAYETLLKTYPHDHFILMGDSAGAGLALAFAQTIQKDPIKQPEKLILFSPWLDVSMTNPDIEPLEKLDMILSVKALKESAEKYVGSGSPFNPKVSPIYGDFTGLGEILMFYGTHELLYADAQKLQVLSNEKGYDILFKFYPEMQHVWVLSPIDETQQTLLEVLDFINN